MSVAKLSDRRLHVMSLTLPLSLGGSPVIVAEGDIDGFIALDTELMRCEVFGSAMEVASNRCRGLLSLCISDVAKQMLLNNAGLVPLDRRSNAGSRAPAQRHE